MKYQLWYILLLLTISAISFAQPVTNSAASIVTTDSLGDKHISSIGSRIDTVKSSPIFDSLAPNFSLSDLRGQFHYLNDYCGTKRNVRADNTPRFVVLSFWATWCAPCLQEIPILEKLAERYSASEAIFFLINTGESAEMVAPFVEGKGYTLPVLLDRYQVYQNRYNVTSLPRLFLIDPDQQIVLEKAGFQDSTQLVDDLGGSLDSLLAAWKAKKEPGDSTGMNLNGNTPSPTR